MGIPQPVPPGHWELLVSPPEDLYFASHSAYPAPRSRIQAASSEGETQLYFGPLTFGRVQVVMSSRPARLRGLVSSGTQPVAGAPVYLYPVDADVRRRLGGLRTAITDLRGGYRLAGLAPGEYLVLSSFDLEEFTGEALAAARAKSVRLKEGLESTQDLELYQAPQ